MVYSLKLGHQPRKYRRNSGLQALTNSRIRWLWRQLYQSSSSYISCSRCCLWCLSSYLSCSGFPTTKLRTPSGSIDSSAAASLCSTTLLWELLLNWQEFSCVYLSFPSCPSLCRIHS